MSLSRPSTPTAETLTWDDYRFRIHRKYQIKQHLECCADEDLHILHKVPFVINDDGTTKMNPRWLHVAGYLLHLSPVEACEKFLMYYLDGKHLTFKKPSEGDVSMVQGLSQSLLDSNIRLAELGLHNFGDALVKRNCGFCSTSGSHVGMYCPRYATYDQRLKFIEQLGTTTCTGCGSARCGLMRTEHAVPYSWKYLCGQCKSNDHIEPLCDNPCAWKKIRNRLNRVYIVAKATKNWTIDDFSKFWSLYMSKAI